MFNIKGLTSEEVLSSRKLNGSNKITEKKKTTIFGLIIEAMNDPIIKILLIALGVKILFFLNDSDIYETIGIIVAIILATVISSLSEYGSEKAFQKLSKSTSNILVKVIRDSVVKNVSIEEVVKGDYVYLESGDKVPADGVIYNGSVYIDESMLSGETKEQYKSVNKKVYRGSVVVNGDVVRKGQKIAELDLFKLNNTLAQQKNGLAQSTLEMQDVLIGQGYAPDNLKAVPADVLELAKVKSGYEQSKAQYESAKYDVEQATLVAPFDGVVANLFEKEHNIPKTSEAFCRVINAGTMEVDFTVLESELPLIKVGDKVEVTPYASAAGVRQGSISEINPLVDENGMVRVKARVNGGNKLFDGMNVRVSVKRSVGEQLVIPKTAVVLRSGKQVVFTLKDGKAMWNYVHTGLENMEEYTITDGLEEGMEVIVTGNVNLAHEAPVKVIKN